MKKNVKAVTCAALSMLLVNSGMVLYAKDDETVKDETVYAMLKDLEYGEKTENHGK